MRRLVSALPAGVLWLACSAMAAGESAAVWRYSFQNPPAGWEKEDFDDSSWKQGAGGFGAGNVHGSPIGTAWTTSDIWVRRTVELPGKLPAEVCLRIHHDEDAEVYVNGVPAAKLAGYTTGYERTRMSAEALAALRPGRNVLAAHCRQTRGGQFLDVHVVEGRPAPAPRTAATAKGARPAPAGEDRGPAAPLKTRWAKDVTPDNAWAEYPRPQMVRKEWLNLNGLWDYAIEGPEGPWSGERVANAEFDPLDRLTTRSPAKWDGRILVPFCVESALSGVGRLVRPNQLLWYRRSFEAPAGWSGRRVLLHFEAADWHAKAWVNGLEVGQHRGGYDPFAFDVTDALAAAKDGPHELVVCVWDPTNMGDQAVGKQALPELRKGFRYTPTTGIWQTVWLEPVARWRIDGLRLTPDVDGRRVVVEVDANCVSRSHALDAIVLDGDRPVARATGLARVEVPIPDPKLWSPDRPFLYGLRLTLRHFQDANRVDDEVTSYFGMRKVSLGKDAAGFTRICLNGEPIFQLGPLDQGYWPDGILTPASDAAAAFDVEFLRRIGCNMARVHVKVHPARWYYHCDRLGLLVWQDMVCTRKFDSSITRQSAAQWELEFARMMEHLRNHPSVVMWIVFNEGWGQYDTERLTEWVKDRDPTRLATNASGWTDHGVGDVLDEHDYSFYPSLPVPELAGGRAMVLGECGGFNRDAPEHIWYPRQQSPERIDYVGDVSRMTFGTAERLADGYAAWADQLWQMRHAQGLCAAVYTQITDVEHELNGWLTYDREVAKLDPQKLRELHLGIFRPAPKLREIIPPGRWQAVEWRYLLGKPAGPWAGPAFDDGNWKTGRGPFGKPGTADLPVGTEWEGGEAHLRKAFDLKQIPKRVSLRIVSGGPCEVHLNGQLILNLGGRGRGQRICAQDVPLRPEALGLLREGRNVLAIRCPAAQPSYLDAALLEVTD